METSNLIALGALIVAIIALIPSYYQVFAQDKTAKKKKIAAKVTDKKNIETKSEQTNSDEAKTNDKGNEPKPMPTMLKVIVLAITGVIIGLVELIIFSGVAYLCGIKVDIATMSMVWTIVFYSLFIIPGIFFWFAFCTFTTMLTD